MSATKSWTEKIPRFEALQKKRFLPFTDAEAYRILKVATEAFLIVNCGVALARPLPFTRTISPISFGALG